MCSPLARLRSLARGLLFATGLAACGAEQGTPAGAARGTAPAAASSASSVADTALRDDFGDPIALGARPGRIVSVAPMTTEVLFAMGAGGRVVGRSKWDTSPVAAQRVPDVGDAIAPNVERIVAARPDLVVLYASASNRAAASRLRALGIRTVGFRVDRIGEFDARTRLLGRLVGDSAAAAVVVDSVMRTLARVRATTERAIAAGAARPRVLWPLVGDPLYVIGGGSFLSELVEIAGGRNVFADDARPSPQLSREALLQRDADVVLTGPAGARRIAADPAWRALTAVRAGRVLVLDTALVLRPSVQLGASAELLARLLHPGAFASAGAR